MDDQITAATEEQPRLTRTQAAYDDFRKRVGGVVIQIEGVVSDPGEVIYSDGKEVFAAADGDGDCVMRGYGCSGSAPDFSHGPGQAFALMIRPDAGREVVRRQLEKAIGELDSAFDLAEREPKA